jgi:small subunit ribosomal protein S3
VTIRTSRPGIIIGRKGTEIEKLKTALAKKTKREVFIDIQEVHKPELDAQLVSESIALQLEKRVAFRRAMRKAVDSALRFGCKGIKVRVSGRLNGAEIARSEWYLQGQLPLHTLRADIDYGTTEAHTTYGVIGVKAWLYKGEILEGGKRTPSSQDGEPRRNERGPGGPRDRDRRPPRRDGDRPAGERLAGGPARIGGEHAIGEPVAPVQAAPAETRVPRAGGPIMPPLMPPAQPAWKEPKPEAKAEVKPEEAPQEPASEAAAPSTAPSITTEPENKE